MVNSLISSVRGALETKGPTWVDVAVGGVTFRISVPGSLVDHLGSQGDIVRLYTSLQVREDSLSLYGFPTEETRSAFETLLSINGIGPKVALNILSTFTPDTLALAVESADIKAFATVPGIGTKTANRIVLELKGKLDLAAIPSSISISGDGDVIEALMALGYTSGEAREAMSGISGNGDMSIEEKVRSALQNLGVG